MLGHKANKATALLLSWGPGLWWADLQGILEGKI